jgi:hypothetical protein
MFGFPWSKKESARRDKPLGPRVEQLEAREVPAVIAVGDLYRVPAGQVLSVPAGRDTSLQGAGPVGVLANDFSDTNSGAVLTATLQTVAKYVSPNGSPLPALPFGSLQLSPDGSFTFIAPASATIPQAARDLDGSVRVQFTYVASDQVNQETSNPATVTITIQDAATKLIAVAPESGAAPVVKVFLASNGTQPIQFPEVLAYEQSFTGGVRVAVGDINDDGVDDVVTVPAVTGGPRVRAFDGRNGTVLADFFAFDPAFRGGGYVTVGDFTGDGRNEIIVGAGEGGGPRVQVWAPVFNANGTLAGGNPVIVTDFFAYEPTARNGVRVAAGDLKGIGRDSIVTAPGDGGGPRVRVFDRTNVLGGTVIGPDGLPVQAPGQKASSASGAAVSYLDFFATDASNRGGVYVTTGAVSAAGRQDIITGTGTGVAVVRVFDGRSGGLTRELAVPTDELPVGGGTAGGPGTFAFQNQPNGTLLNPSFGITSLVPGATNGLGLTNPQLGALSGGARVAATDYNGDGLDEILVTGGRGVQPRVRFFDPRTNTVITSILAYEPSFLGGVFVAAG